jgi:GH24 family phage-related lysozyme (muramidase)
MKISKAGEDLMHFFEGYRNKPYRCSAAIWTVGWGHAMYADQLNLPNVRKEGYTGLIRSDYQLKGEDNRVWSKDELVDLFKVDINTFERGVLRLSPDLVNHQSKFDSVVSFAYNAGLGNYQRSTIRIKVNRGDWDGAAEAFMSWTKAGGKEVAGLVKRRKAEVALFLS